MRRTFDRYAKRCGDRGRKPGQMVRIDHMSGAIDTGFAVKEAEAVCPVSKLCRMRAYSRATATCASTFLDRLSRQAPFAVESVQVNGGSESVAGFERRCNAYQPPQALGQRTHMQAYHENVNQSALAA